MLLSQSDTPETADCLQQTHAYKTNAGNPENVGSSHIFLFFSVTGLIMTAAWFKTNAGRQSIQYLTTHVD